MIGYGDIGVETDAARVAAAVQMLFKVVVVGVSVCPAVVGIARRHLDPRHHNDRSQTVIGAVVAITEPLRMSARNGPAPGMRLWENGPIESLGSCPTTGVGQSGCER